MNNKEEFSQYLPTRDFDPISKLTGAVCIVVNQEGKILLLKRDDIEGISYPGHWSAPGGKVEPFETPARAAPRELFEETGLDVNRMTVLCKKTNPCNKADDHIYIAYVHADEGDVNRKEGCAHGFFSKNDIMSMDNIVPYIKEIISDLDVQSFEMSAKPVTSGMLTLRAPHLIK